MVVDGGGEGRGGGWCCLSAPRRTEVPGGPLNKGGEKLKLSPPPPPSPANSAISHRYLWFQLIRNDRVTTSQYCMARKSRGRWPACGFRNRAACRPHGIRRRNTACCP